MVLVQFNNNKTLKGHRLLMLTSTPVPPDYISILKSQFPDLDVVTVEQQWAATDAHTKIPDDVWKGTTILLTGSTVPAVEKAPVLQYVQLQSAGANHIIKNPLFTDTEVAFCTANGVHG